MLNKAMLIGRLGGDPEIRQTQSGAVVVSFNLATTERWTNKNGDRDTRTEWHRVIAWDQLAQICEKYLTKGKLVYVEGPIRNRRWEDSDGNTHRSTEIVAQSLQILDRSQINGSKSPDSVPDTDVPL